MIRGSTRHAGSWRWRTVALGAFVLLVAPVGLGGGGVAAARDLTVAQAAPSSQPSPPVIPTIASTATPPVPGGSNQLLPASPGSSQVLTGGAAPAPTASPAPTSAVPPTIAPSTPPPISPPRDTPGQPETGFTSRALLILVVLDVIVVLAALVIVARRKRGPAPSVPVPGPAEPLERVADRTVVPTVVDPVALKPPVPARPVVVLRPDVMRRGVGSGLLGWLPVDVAGVDDPQPVAAAVALPLGCIVARRVGATDRLDPGARQLFVLAANQGGLRLWLPATAVVRTGDPLRVHGSSTPLILTGRPEDEQGGAALERLDLWTPARRDPVVVAPLVRPRRVGPTSGAGTSAAAVGARVVLVGGLTNGAPGLSDDVRGVRDRPRERVGGRARGIRRRPFPVHQ